MTDYSPDTPFSTIWLSGVGELVFSVQLSPTRHKQNIHKVTNLLNSMTGVCWKEAESLENSDHFSITNCSVFVQVNQFKHRSKLKTIRLICLLKHMTSWQGEETALIGLEHTKKYGSLYKDPLQQLRTHAITSRVCLFFLNESTSTVVSLLIPGFSLGSL